MGLVPHLGGTTVIDRVRDALLPESVAQRVRELLERDLHSRAHLEKVRVSIEQALAGDVRHAREIYPEI
jgi:hypothetical protein